MPRKPRHLSILNGARVYRWRKTLLGDAGASYGTSGQWANGQVCQVSENVEEMSLWEAENMRYTVLRSNDTYPSEVSTCPLPSKKPLPALRRWPRVWILN